MERSLERSDRFDPLILGTIIGGVGEVLFPVVNMLRVGLPVLLPVLLGWSVPSLVGPEDLAVEEC